MWRFDFVAFPLLAGALAAFYCRSPAWAGLWLLGFVLGTLAEYWVHRTALHGFMWHGTHERHHTHPEDLVEFPIWFTPAIFAGFFVVMPLAVFAGFVAWYVYFLYWHHILHHTELAFARQYAAWHLLHHTDDTCNYGITHPSRLWDVVFRTNKEI